MVPEEITPLVPAVVGEKLADDQTCFILETLLKYMVIQVEYKSHHAVHFTGVQRKKERYIFSPLSLRNVLVVGVQ